MGAITGASAFFSRIHPIPNRNQNHGCFRSNKHVLINFKTHSPDHFNPPVLNYSLRTAIWCQTECTFRYFLNKKPIDSMFPFRSNTILYSYSFFHIVAPPTAHSSNEYSYLSCFMHVDANNLFILVILHGRQGNCKNKQSSSSQNNIHWQCNGILVESVT